MKYKVLICIWLFFNGFLTAQIPSIHSLKNLSSIEQRWMPSVKNESLQKKYQDKLSKGAPMQFAENFIVNINPIKDGEWSSLSSSRSVWRIKLGSKNAYSLNLGFDQFILPKSASLFILDKNDKIALGPLSSSDNDEHEQYWTPIINSDEITVLLEVDDLEIEHLKLNINAVNHDFIGIQNSISGSCNLDVICGAADGFPEVEAYRDIIRSVGMFTINGVDICSGFLVNNTSQDCRPLFITAFHCGVGASQAPSVVAYWRFENSTCRQPGSPASGGNGDGSRMITNTGSKILASWQNSDFQLLEFDEEINPDAQAFFAGWDATDQVATSAIAIHHPSLDEKRISFENDPLHIGDWGSADDVIPGGDHLIVNDWDLGTTEGGSSGSPLFNAEGKVIGQLHGGQAACGNDAYDSYGWLFSSWEGGGALSNSLKSWLDPIQSGQLTLNGKDCGFSIEIGENLVELCSDVDQYVTELQVSELFESNVNLTVLEKPAELTIQFDSQQLSPGGSTMLTINNIGSLAMGDHLLRIEANDGINISTADLRLRIFTSVPATSILQEPQNTMVDVVITPTLIWNSDPSVRTYRLRLAEESTFADPIIIEPSLNTNTYSINQILKPLQTYYWQVRAENACGENQWSSISTFTTINLACLDDTSEDLPQTIQSNDPNVIFSELMIDQGGEIIDINVDNIVGSHSFVGDLIISLISPSGKEAVLVSQECGFSADFNVSFDDEAEEALSCPYNRGLDFRPTEALSIFEGEDAFGVWILRVEDTQSFDGGILNNWGLTICIDPDTDFSINPSVNIVEICEDESTEISIKIGGAFEEIESTDFIVETLSGEASMNLITTISQNDEEIIYGVNVDTDSSPGSFKINLTVNDIAGNEGKNSFIVEVNPKPQVITLISPIDGAEKQELAIDFKWSEDAASQMYKFELSKNDSFTDLVVSNQTQNSELSIPGGLDQNTTYFWKVESRNGCGEEVSDVYSFTTDMVDALQQIQVNDLNTYPNPAKGLLYVSKMDGFLGTNFISIYSNNGSLLQASEMISDGGILKINTESLDSGLYFLKINNKNSIYALKFMVQK